MSQQTDQFFEPQDIAAKAIFQEMTGDELTAIAVEALCRAFQLMKEDLVTETLH